jgi:lysophospholipid acyltransferase (LPLAT)-like uncharacterized protein
MARGRALKFWLLHRLVLPTAAVLLRLIMMTWRLEPDAAARLRTLAAQPRVAIAMFHGGALLLMRYALMPGPRERRKVVMTSPSRDGLLLDALLARFGLETAKGSSKSRGRAGAVEMIRHAREGTMAIMAVDGPRGPLGIPKPGVVSIARGGQAPLYIVTTSADRAITFGSWDRMFLPLPFTRIRVDIHLYNDTCAPHEEEALRLGRVMRDRARALDSPLARALPPEEPAP